MDNTAQLEALVRANTKTEVLLEQLATIATDHESRLRWIERATSLALGGGALAYFLAELYVEHGPI